MTSGPTIVVCDAWNAAESTLRETFHRELDGATVEVCDARTEQQAVDAVAGAEAIVVGTRTPVTPDVLDAAGDQLTAIGRSGTGVDNIDVAAADRAGVTVVNVPDYCAAEVGTHAFALLLSAARRLHVYDQQTRDGGWGWEVGAPLHRLDGQTLGLAGFGEIARELLDRAAGLPVETVVQDPYVDDDAIRAAGAEPVDFEALCARSDLLSIHTPLTPETEAQFDRAAFDRMPDDAVVVNTGRGGVVDGEALAAALDDHLGAAALDVLPTEPPADSPLLGREDVLVTPHAGWYSEEARRTVSESVATDVARVLRGETPDSRVDPDRGW